MRGYFVSLSLLVSMIARADSACWPEQKLLGTPTQSLIQSVNYFLTDRSRLVETTNPEPSLVTDWQNGICQVSALSARKPTAAWHSALQCVALCQWRMRHY